MSFKIGKIEVERGKRAQFFLDVAPKADGSFIRFPVIVVNGVKEGPTLVVSGCVHGNEPNSALSIIQFVRGVDPSTLKGTLVAVPVVNLEAFSVKKRGNEVFDGWKWDLNRIWPGKPDGYPLERLAHAFVYDIASKADYHMDFHSGGYNLFIAPSCLLLGGKGEETSEAFQIAKSSGVSIIMQGSPGGSLTSAIKEKNITSLGFEVGSGIMSPEDYHENIAIHARICKNVMKKIGMLEGEPEGLPAEVVVLEDEGITRVDFGGFAISEPGLFMQMVKKDAQVGRIYDILGNELQKLYAPNDGLVWAIRVDPVVQPGDYGVVWVGKIRKTLNLDAGKV